MGLICGIIGYPDDDDDESDDDVTISIPQRSPFDTSSDTTPLIDITSNFSNVSKQQISVDQQSRRSARTLNIVNYKDMLEVTIRDKTNQEGNSKSSLLLEHTASQVQQIDSDLNDTTQVSICIMQSIGKCQAQ